MLVAALAGAAALAAAAFATQGCGSVFGAADADGGGRDATEADGGIDGDAIDADAGAATAHCACPDAGYFITVLGDGPAQTLRSNGGPAIHYPDVPDAPWAQAYYAQGLAMSGSEDPDGGASLQLDIEITEDADGGLALVGPGSAYAYAYYTRQDGTSFSPTSGLSASMTLTEADPPGGLVAGSYTATVVDSKQADGGSLSLSGTFVTCRLCDWSGPTPKRP